MLVSTRHNSTQKCSILLIFVQMCSFIHLFKVKPLWPEVYIPYSHSWGCGWGQDDIQICIKKVFYRDDNWEFVLIPKEKWPGGMYGIYLEFAHFPSV